MPDAKSLTEDGEGKVVAPAMDQAAMYLAQAEGYPPMSPEAEKRMVRKMDWILLPMVCVCVAIFLSRFPQLH